MGQREDGEKIIRRLICFQKYVAWRNCPFCNEVIGITYPFNESKNHSDDIHKALAIELSKHLETCEEV